MSKITNKQNHIHSLVGFIDFAKGKIAAAAPANAEAQVAAADALLAKAESLPESFFEKITAAHGWNASGQQVGAMVNKA